MKIKLFIFILPSVIGGYFGFTVETLADFLLTNIMLNGALGVVCGTLFLAMALRESRARPKDRLSKRDVIMILGMPILSALLFSTLFGIVVWTVINLIR